MKIDVLTLFPEMFENFANTSIIKRAISNNNVTINTINIILNTLYFTLITTYIYYTNIKTFFTSFFHEVNTKRQKLINNIISLEIVKLLLL